MLRKLLVLAFVLTSLSPTVDSVSAQTYESVVEKIHYTHPDRMIGNKPYDALKQIGNPHPEIVLYIWGDLNTPYTKKFFDEVFGTLLNKYQDRALFVYNHRAFLSQDKSILAGMIGECAARQGYFWDNIGPIMSNLDDLNSLDYLINVDIDKMRVCLSDPYTKSVINISEGDGKYFGFNGIPVIVIQNARNTIGYSVKVNGAQSLEIFEQALWEAQHGDLNSQQLSAVRGEINELKDEVSEIQKKQSFLEKEIEKIREFLQRIWLMIVGR